MRISWHDFSKGLWVLGGKEQTMQGFVRRSVGMHSVRQPSLRSRNGSQRANVNAPNPVNAIQIGVDGTGFPIISTSTTMYYGSSIVTSSLTGDRPITIVAPVENGGTDWVFISSSGVKGKFRTGTPTTVHEWGIAAPSTAPTAADNGAGAMAAGTYQYRVTFGSSLTGSESNPSSAASVTIGASRQVQLTSIPVSTDAQVDRRHIYRTSAGGSLFFLLTTISDNSTTTYNDNTVDANLNTDLLFFDNVKPDSSYNFPWWSPSLQRMFWCQDGSSSGSQERIYYSPPGRPESVQGFMRTGSPGSGIIAGVEWNERNWAFGGDGIYRIDGTTEPFVATKISATQGIVPGNSWVIAVTPSGIVYYATDRTLRIFDGQRTIPIGWDQFEGLTRLSPTTELDLTFSPTSIAYGRDEIFLANTSRTLAYHTMAQTWRELGVGCSTITMSNPNDNLYASFNGDAQSLELQGLTTDTGAGISIDWELGGNLQDISQHATLQRIYLDIDTSDIQVTAICLMDGTVSQAFVFSTPIRQMVEFNIGRTCRVFSVRLQGTANATVELFGIEADVYIPGSQPSAGRG